MPNIDKQDMLKIDLSIIDKINNAATPEDLYEFLQAAIKLEHSTIPPYLTALYSIKTDPDALISDILQSTVIEEMLHFTIAGNILISLGGKPVINNKDFVPQYPGQLPMIKDSVEVGLTKFSADLVENVFMKIEHPEHPLDIPVVETIALFKSIPQYATIGDFYMAIQAKIKELPAGSFKNVDLQVTHPYYGTQLFKITNADDAVKAINIIIEQGEGTDKSPDTPMVDGTGEPAHYYRFQQIIKGRTLILDPVKGYVFGGDKIDVSTIEVYPLWENTKIKDLEGHPAEWAALNDFNKSYTQLLAGLDDTFNGKPANIQAAITSMRHLRGLAKNLVKLPFPGKDGFNIGPSFEYTV